MLTLKKCVKVLKDSNNTLATAESCTGGLLGSLLTSLPGSSNWYVGGWITYSNQMKCEMLQVPADLINKYGPVSKPVALAMCKNTLRLSGANYSVSITGLAGPSGGTDDLPVGSVWIAVAGDADHSVKYFQFPGSREEIRQQACESALTMFISLATG